MKKFTENDIFVNTIKVYPKVRIFVYSGSVTYNDTKNSGVLLNDFLLSLPGPGTSLIPENAIAAEDGIVILTEDGDYIVIE